LVLEYFVFFVGASKDIFLSIQTGIGPTSETYLFEKLFEDK
jgi:hypothetical protein